MPIERQHYRRRRPHRGFTLMESLMAAAVLFAGVLAIVTAVSAGQKKAFEAELQVLATLTVEELMGDVTATQYADILTYWGFATDEVDTPRGTLAYIVTAVSSTQDLTALGITIAGYDVTITVLEGATGRQLLQMSRFIPEPGS